MVKSHTPTSMSYCSWKKSISPTDMITIPLFFQGFIHVGWLFWYFSTINSTRTTHPSGYRPGKAKSWANLRKAQVGPGGGTVEGDDVSRFSLELYAWMSRWKLGSMVSINGLFHPSMPYTPFISRLKPH